MENQFKMSSKKQENVSFINATSVNDDIVDTSINNLMVKNSSITAKSQIAISYSYLTCLTDICKNKYTIAGIIEDDIRLCDNFNEKLEEYFTNAPDILNIMKERPCILHLVYSPIKSIVEGFKEKSVVGICFNLLNHQAAKILIDNFYPIKYQFDTYVYHTCRENNIKEYVADPLLGWDLSSTMYEQCWDQEDRAMHGRIKTLSRDGKLSVTVPNIIINNQICRSLYKPYTSSISALHHYDSLTEFNKMTSPCIISGQGVCNNQEISISKDTIILFVRGPLTRKYLVDHGYKCPEEYLEPLLLYKTEQVNRKKNSVLHIINIEPDIDNLLKDIKYHKEVCTNNYVAFILCILYDVTIYWIKDGDYLQIKDFLLGCGLDMEPVFSLINPVSIKIDKNIILDKQHKLIQYMIFE